MDSLLNQLGQYGVLGLITALLIGGLVAVFKMLITQVEKRIEQNADDLKYTRELLSAEVAKTEGIRKELNQYIRDDREAQMRILEKCATVLERVERKLNG
jgi:hypothetical protein